jgi:O-antigen ligase
MAALVPGLDTVAVRARAKTATLVLAAAAVTFLGAKGDLGRPADLVLVAGAVLAAVAAIRWPDHAASLALALVVFVPIYWAQPMPGLPVAATPATVTGIALLPAALLCRQRIRLTFLDAAVALFFVLTMASIGANVEGKVASLAELFGRSILPYIVFRVLAARPGGPRRLALAAVTAALPLAVLGIRESNGDGNPFFTAVRPGLEAGQWIRSQVRFGHIRAEASFGQAIAFSLFLAIALLLVLGLSWRARRGGGRVVLVASAAVLVAALFATGSRGGIVSLAVGALLWAATLRTGRRGLVVLALLVGAALVLTPAGSQVAQLRSSVSDSGEAGEAARYRLEIAHIVTDPKSFSMLGLETPPGLGAVNGAKELLGLRTIDSQYAVVYVTNGVVGLAAFTLVALTLLAVTMRRRLDALARAWAAAAAATAVALTTVALFTQMLSLFWIAVAVTAAVTSQPDDA